MLKRWLRRNKATSPALPKPDRAITFHTTNSLYIWYENGRLVRYRSESYEELGIIDEIQYYSNEPDGNPLSFGETWQIINPDGRPVHPAVLFIVDDTTKTGPTSQLVFVRRINSDEVSREIEDFARSRPRPR